MRFEYCFLPTFFNAIYCYRKINMISHKLGPGNRLTVKSVSDDAFKELVFKKIFSNFLF